MNESQSDASAATPSPIPDQLGARRRTKRIRIASRLGVGFIALAAIVAAVFSLLPNPSALAAASALSGKTITQVVTGGDHSCALTSDGAVSCWGSNNHGQLGNNTTTSRSLATAVTTLGTPLAGKVVTQVSVGGSFTCALTAGNANSDPVELPVVACWGDNTHGQLGNGTTDDALVPTAITTSSTPLSAKTITAITTGSQHVCALASDSTLACWGLQTSGRLGNGETSATDVETPTAVTTSGTDISGLTVTAISAGDAHTCVRTSSNVIACWGVNGSGQLGDNSTTTRSTPVATAVADTPLDGLAIAGISAGGAHTCAVSVSGIVACWGENGDNELGDGTTDNSSVPISPTLTATPIATSTILSVSSGVKDTCVVATGGAVSCWGNNGTGSVGDNTTTTRAVPTAVVTTGTALAGKSVVTVSAGNRTACALTSDGTAACWGDNSDGKIGDGTTTQRNVPTAVITNPLVSVDSIDGQRTGVSAYGRIGEVLTVSGSWWDGSQASGDFTVTIGGVTAAGQSLETDSSGVLSGTITVPATAATGAGSLVIANGTDTVTRSFYVLGTRTVTLSPTSGVPGTVTAVTATNFDPVTDVQIRGLTSTSGPTVSDDTPVDTTTTSTGTLASTNFTVNDYQTVSIEVREKFSTGGLTGDYARAAFTVPPVTVAGTAVSGQRSGVIAYGRPGQVVSVTGSYWPLSLTSSDFTAAFCDSSGDNCDSNATKSLSTSSIGALSGTVTIPSNASTGARTLKVTNAGRSALFDFTVLGVRSVTLSPTSGGLGTLVSVTASNFDPSAFVTVQGVRNTTGPVNSGDVPVAGFTGSDGSLSSTGITINDRVTTAIEVFEDSPAGDPETDRAFASYSTLTAVLVIDSVTGQRSGVSGYARKADVINVSGTGWAVNKPSSGITALLCQSDGTGCDPAATSSLSTNGSGDLTGTVTVPSGATTGSRAVKIVATSSNAFAPITILGNRTVTVISTPKPLGEAVQVTASNFDPGASVLIKSASSVSGASPTYTADTAVAATIDNTGALSATSFTLSTPGSIVVVENDADANSAVDWAAANYNALVPGTTLSVQAYVTGSNPTNGVVDFGSLVTPLSPTTLTGSLNRLQVVDQRNGSLGWSLTASLTNFVGNAASMSNSVVTITPSCSVVGSASASGIAPGTAAQSLSEQVLLCEKDATQNDGGTTSGVYNVSGSMALTVPAFQKAGTYTAILTVSLA